MAEKLIINYEGLDYSGKSTQVGLTGKYLNTLGMPFISVREPGGTSLGESIRSILLSVEPDPDVGMAPLAELLLFLSARAQLFYEVISKYDGVVLLDRSGDSSVAYQGFGRLENDKDLVDLILRNNKAAYHGESIIRTYFVDITVDEVFERMSMYDRFFDRDRMERNSRDFFEKTRKGYLWVAEREPDRFKVIDGMQSIESVFKDIKKDLDVLLDEHGYSPKAL